MSSEQRQHSVNSLSWKSRAEKKRKKKTEQFKWFSLFHLLLFFLSSFPFIIIIADSILFHASPTQQFCFFFFFCLLSFIFYFSRLSNVRSRIGEKKTNSYSFVYLISYKELIHALRCACIACICPCSGCFVKRKGNVKMMLNGNWFLVADFNV